MASSRPEAVQHVLHARATADEDRLAERTIRVDLDDVSRRDRQHDALRPIVLRVGDPLEVVANHVGEDPLACQHDREDLLVPVPCGVVVQDRGPVGVQPARRQGVLDPKLLLENQERATKVLHRDPGLAEGSRDHPFGQPDERDSRQTCGRGYGGDQGSRADLPLPARPADVAVCPGRERRPGHTEEGRRLLDGVQWHVEAQVVHGRHCPSPLPFACSNPTSPP